MFLCSPLTRCGLLFAIKLVQISNSLLKSSDYAFFHHTIQKSLPERTKTSVRNMEIFRLHESCTLDLLFIKHSSCYFNHLQEICETIYPFVFFYCCADTLSCCLLLIFAIKKTLMKCPADFVELYKTFSN